MGLFDLQDVMKENQSQEPFQGLWLGLIKSGAEKRVWKVLLTKANASSNSLSNGAIIR